MRVSIAPHYDSQASGNPVTYMTGTDIIWAVTMTTLEEPQYESCGRS